MTGTIGAILPLALGIAISPVPIIAAILMLLSPKAKSTSLGFMLGWVVGIVVAVVVFIALSSVIPPSSGTGSKPVQGVIELLLGLLLLFVAFRQWKGRPAPGEEAELPKWMQAIDQITFGKAFGLGFLLAAVNPKNLMMAVAAGVDIGSAGLSIGSVVVVVLIFTLLAACTVVVPVVGYLIASDRLSGPLDALRIWLSKENAVIMAVVMLVLGVSLIGKGIGSF